MNEAGTGSDRSGEMSSPVGSGELAGPAAFYQPLGDGAFASTAHTAGPWSPEYQHFGPPAALLARAMEQLPAERPATIARLTVEILGPLPLVELTVRARVARPGRSVELLEAELVAGEARLATASAWRIVRSDSAEQAAGGANGLPPVATAAPMTIPPDWSGGYLDAMEWRSVTGELAVSGPACAWVRQRVPLVEGEQPSPLQRLLTVADSGNGLSNRLDVRRWWFINTELTVHLQREPEGEWIALDANTVIGPHGVGTATSVLHDVHGQVATGAQELMIRPRDPS